MYKLKVILFLPYWLFINDLKIKCDDADKWNGKGMILFHVEKYDEALSSFEIALEINPNHESAKRNKEFIFIQEIKSSIICT